MKHVKKSVLLWHSAQKMYDLVTAVPDYPKFLPWCERAEVLESGPAGMTARLHLAYRGVRHAFTTRNVHEPGRSVLVSLVDGPFSRLDGHWHFVPLQGPEDPPGTSSACRVEFELSYAFSSVALEALISPVFDRIANTLVDAFVKRADQVLGSY